MKRDIYAARASSVGQRVLLIIASGASLAAAWWLLFGGGILLFSAWRGLPFKLGDEARRRGLALALSVYFVRLLFTQFVFLKRAISWSEAFMIGLWILFIYLLFALAGGTNPAELNIPFGLGAVLFIFGSWMNSYAEYARHVWKQRAENSRTSIHAWPVPIFETSELPGRSDSVHGPLSHLRPPGMRSHPDNHVGRLRIWEYSDARFAPA